jgi:heme/copper-type cytochrome/quinol oxidase subunit 3
MSELAHPATDYSVVEQEPPELLARNLRISSRIWSSATFFFFFAFLFAYFYLRSLNEHGLWKPKGVSPSVTLGTFSAAAVVAAAALLWLGLRDHRATRRREWRIKGGVALGALLLAIVLQVVEWATQGFGPTDGGYASVYLGWTSLQLLFLVGLAVWVEMTLATSFRYRKVVPAEFATGEAAGDAHRAAPDIADPLSLVRAELESVTFFGAVFAVTVAVSWFVLYIL